RGGGGERHEDAQLAREERPHRLPEVLERLNEERFSGSERLLGRVRVDEVHNGLPRTSEQVPDDVERVATLQQLRQDEGAAIRQEAEVDAFRDDAAAAQLLEEVLRRVAGEVPRVRGLRRDESLQALPDLLLYYGDDGIGLARHACILLFEISRGQQQCACPRET